MGKDKSYIDPTGESRELDGQFFEKARRGRPALPEDVKKQRVNLMLDPEVIEKLREKGNMSAEVNAALRKALGIARE